ncbi:MAG: dolichyl-phosphate beta-glucosyltransferase [Acidimicrobiia bacterium]
MTPQPQPSDRPVLDLVVPVLDEAHVLERQIHRLRDALEPLPFSWRITIADNGSTDGTGPLAVRLAAELPDLRVVHLPVAGRGRALREAWSTSDAFVLAYTDVDLSTGLTALLPMIAPLISGHASVATGSRLLHGSHVERGAKREFLSRVYNALLQGVLGARFRDAQCGFKAIRADAAQALLPVVVDDAWFFDTELLVRAQRHGLRIIEVPVDWIDDTDSRVDIRTTVRDDLRGVARLARELGFRRRGAPFPSPTPMRVSEVGRAA